MYPNNEYLETLLFSLGTKEEADLLISELDILLASLYQTNSTDFQHALSTKVRAKTVLLLQEFFLKEHTVIDNKDALHQTITYLQQSIKNCSILALDLAFEPTEETLSLIQAWLKELIHEPVLIALRTKHDLIGGCVFSFKGKYRDYSLKEPCRKALERLFEQKTPS